MVQVADSLDPETILVAGGLRTPALIAEAAKLVEPEDFTDQRLRTLWLALVGLVNSGLSPDTIDSVTLAAAMAKGMAARRKIALYCEKLGDGLPRFSSLVKHAEEIRRRATVRIAGQRLAKLSEEIAASDGWMPDLEAKLTGLSMEISARNDERLMRRSFADVVKEVGVYFDELLLGPSADTISTGIKSLDHRLGGGVRPGRLYTLVAPTGAGKTAFASQISDQVAVAGRRVIMFSMEVDPLDVYIRDVERVARRSRWGLRSKYTAQKEASLEALNKARSELIGRQHGKIVYGEPMSVVGMRQVLLTEQLRGGPVGLIVVDHAQVAKPSKDEKAGMPRYLEVKGVATGLRQIAQRLNVAVLLTAQMNPPHKGERPTMALTRESKDIVNASDAVMVLWHEREEAPDGDVYITGSFLMLEKARAGAPGLCRITYHGEQFRFEDAEVEDGGHD